MVVGEQFPGLGKRNLSKHTSPFQLVLLSDIWILNALSLSLALSIINTISVSLTIRFQVFLCASAPSNGVQKPGRSATKSEICHVSSYRKIWVVTVVSIYVDSIAARRKHLLRLLIFQGYGLADHLSWLFSGTYHSSNSNFGPPQPPDLLNLERLAPWRYCGF